LAKDQNRRDALERLVELIRAAAISPKRRRTTKSSKAAKKQRLEGKRRRSATKDRRGKVAHDD
jgi:ribosome-associated protein